MTITTHTLGFPRIGAKRELKKALEAYWAEQMNQAELKQVAATLRQTHWQLQQEHGIDLVPVGDFAFYDHVLSTSLLFGIVPKRHQASTSAGDFDLQFQIARGQTQTDCCHHAASDMTKWFNTNYHYIVPELAENQQFSLSSNDLKQQLAEASQLQTKLVLLGPVSLLWLGRGLPDDKKLALLPALTQCYQQLLDELQPSSLQWLQIDEPLLATAPTANWLHGFSATYQDLQKGRLKLLLTSYFASIEPLLPLISRLPFDGLHLDLTVEPSSLATLEAQIPAHWVISAGVVSGRNIWKSDLAYWYQQLLPVFGKRHSLLWLAPSCSLLHCPLDVRLEKKLPAQERATLAFAVQKCQELQLLRQALQSRNSQPLVQYSAVLHTRQQQDGVIDLQVRKRCQQAKTQPATRKEPLALRRQLQQTHFNLPLLPTTTIGSFPQTKSIRALRRSLKCSLISKAEYDAQIEQHIAQTIQRQLDLGLDVLVHGEAERNDMVEYFAAYLTGYRFTQAGWVQSYGSRCVKPPIIYGDIKRPAAMTVHFSQYAQSLSPNPVKGMLTGPITMLNWSFVRDDLPREDIALQLALAISDEVCDLQQAGIDIIQIDEPALREGLPLQHQEWPAYLDWSVDAFKRCSSQVAATTQIHTHMCYAEFNDIMPAIAALDADVISIETSRSNMELLQAFEAFAYPAAIGPGVYDIHSPNIPTIAWIKQLLCKASKKIPLENLWVNPDCGLKTRGWDETEAALKNMVQASHELRKELAERQ